MVREPRSASPVSARRYTGSRATVASGIPRTVRLVRTADTRLLLDLERVVCSLGVCEHAHKVDACLKIGYVPPRHALHDRDPFSRLANGMVP